MSSGNMYFIENIFPALNQPGEWYQFPNGTIYYWPMVGDDINNSEVFYPIVGNAFRTTQFSNYLFENLEFLYFTDYALRFSMPTNHTIRNCTIKHSNSAISTNNNITVENCLLEDFDSMAIRLHTGNGVTIRNNIIRNAVRVNYDQSTMHLYNGRNILIINNDISGSYSSPIMYTSTTKDKTQISNVTIKDNHIHHVGFNVLNDLGGIQALAVPNGLIIDHNWIHDVYSAKKIGNGLFVGSGAVGVIMKNNLVYDISNDGLKMDIGRDITLHNNIIGFCGYLVTWSSYKDGEIVYNINNNIFMQPETYILSGTPWREYPERFVIDKNIYWDYNDPNRLNWAYKNFSAWQEYGKDKSSFIIDPLFVDAEKRNFSFSSNKNYKKIGFKPFSLTFGVVGEEWRKVADSFVHPEPYGTPAEIQRSVFYDFEDKEENKYVKWSNSNTDSTKHFHNKKSLLMKSSGGKNYDTKKRPTLTISLDWSSGVSIFSVRLFLPEKTWMNVDLNLGSKIDIKDGFVRYNDKEITEHPVGEWFEFKVTVGYGENYTGNFSVSINNKTETIEASSSFSSTPNAVVSVIRSSSDSYVDYVNATSGFKQPEYFREEIESKNGLQSQDGGNDNSKGDNDQNNASNVGAILGGVIGSLVIHAIIIVLLYLFVFRKKISNSADECSDEEASA